MILVRAAAERSISSAVEGKLYRCSCLLKSRKKESVFWQKRNFCRSAEAADRCFEKRKEVKKVVELDQFKYTLGTYAGPLKEVGDSL